MKSDSCLGLLIKVPLMFIGVLLDVIIILWVIEYFTGGFCTCECKNNFSAVGINGEINPIKSN